MSICSIYSNIDKIKEYLKEIDSKKFDSDWLCASFVITDCAVKQYEMKRNYLNINTVNKQALSDDLKGFKYLDHMYQHIYMHNHIAMEDELYEVFDALDKYKNKLLNDKDTTISELLILEEYIDAYHFITELTGTLEEHYLHNLECKNRENSYHSANSNYLFVGSNNFSDKVKILLNEEGSHIISYLYDNDMLSELNSEVSDEDCLYNLLRLNRDFIRETNFKDWKQYPDDYFNSAKFGKLYILNRKMYGNIIKGIYNSLECIAFMTNKEIKSNSDIFKFIWAVYMTKRDENIRRQKEDKRYKLDNIGEAVGVEVK